MAITIPDWILQSNKNALFSSRDLYQLFGYKSAASLITASHKGWFPSPDGNGHKMDVKIKLVYWRKQTDINEINKRNNGEKITPNAEKEAFKLKDRSTVYDSKLITTDYLPHG